MPPALSRLLVRCLAPVLQTFSLTALFIPLSPAQPPPGAWSAVTAEGALREAWTRGNDRFLRQWLTAVVTDHPTAELRPGGDWNVGQLAVGDDPAGPRWLPLPSFGDVVDLSAAPAVAPPQRDAQPRRVWAVATIEARADGPADLLVGADGRFRIWLNGTLVVSRDDPAEFCPDDVRVPVMLQPGRNQLQAEFQHAPAGEWRMTARVVPAGARVRPLEDFWPQLRAEDGRLSIAIRQTDAGGRLPVRVQAIQPGGSVAAELLIERGASQSIDTRHWTPGPYDLRFASHDAWGAPVVAYRSWYVGEPTDGIRELEVAAQRAEPGTRHEHLKLLLDLTREAQRSGGEQAKFATSPLFEFSELPTGAGPDPRIRGGGFVRLAWIDAIDGATQFARVYLPQGYTDARPWPMVVSLHGFNPPNPPYSGWWSVESRHNVLAEQKGVILLEPHGRGNAQYRGIGEHDVLRAIVEAKRLLAVDDDRVYLTGESMGGSGTWLVGSRHSRLFAAIAPVYGGWDFRVEGMGGPAVSAGSPREAFRAELRNSFSNAENLGHVPVLVLHGDADPAVSVEHSRHAVRLLQRWSYPVQYRELPGWAHEDLNRRGEIIDWLLQHRRASAPRTARVRSPNLAGASADWVRVDAMQHVERVIRVDAEVMAPGQVRLDTDNVRALTLTLPAALRGNHDTVQVVWNGRTSTFPTSEHLHVSETASPDETLAKGPGVEGPIPAILEKPFLVVVGTTSADPRMREFCAAKGEALAALWQRWQHQELRRRRDCDVSPEEAKTHSLILIGGADANAVTARLAPHLPFAIVGEQVTVDGRTWAATDAVLEMIYPHPEAPEHHVLVVAGTSPAGLYFWRPQLVHAQFGFPTTTWDWTLQDGRAETEPGLFEPDALVIAAGVFDPQWRRQDLHTIEGRTELRRRARLRTAPAAGLVLSPASLQSLAGAYQLPSGQRFTVEREGEQLVVEAPGQGRVRLMPESENSFADPITGDWAHFERRADQSITLTALHAGTIIQAVRL